MSDRSPLPEWLPEWLSDRAVADDLFATAYESCSSAQRGWLKKCISLHFALCGEAPAQSRIQLDYPRLGVSSTVSERPVSWVVLVLPQDIASPVRTLAAIIPAMLAGVREVIVVRLRQNKKSASSEWPSGLLVGLELAGVRRIVDLTATDCSKLLDTLVASGSSGRILSLDCGLTSGPLKNKFSQETVSRNIRFWHGSRPSIGVMRSLSESIAESGDTLEDVLAWAHPDVSPELLASTSESEKAGHDALLIAAGYSPDTPIPAGIVLGPGLEGCWLWPDLHRDFFLRRTLYCSSSVPLASE